MLRLVTPATDPNILTIEELRAAVGVMDDGDDVALRALGAQVSTMMAAACHVVRAGSNPPTLRQETLAQTFAAGVQLPIVMSRRFCELVSVDVSGATVPLDGADLDYSTGILAGMDRWAGRMPLRITYKAGFATVPADLVYAAMLAVREFHSAAARDPLLRAETSDDLGRLEYQIGGTNRVGPSPLPAATLAILSPYMSVAGL